MFEAKCQDAVYTSLAHLKNNNLLYNNTTIAMNRLQRL